MRVPYSWLKDYVDVDLPVEALAHRLTMAGLEVDRVDYGWPGIVTAQILWQERIKGSDHLWATRVTTGTEELSVVCGAPNIQVRDKVPLARVGAKVGEITIGEKRAMGVLSQGMLCSPRELGLSDDHAGILILPPDTPLGVPLGAVIGEPVIDLDIKAHRGDLFCMVGVAREIAAFTGETLRPPATGVKEKGTPAAKLMKLEVRDADLCPRYTARVIRNVTIAPSPQWMADRLIAAGMRPINNVVDITNYVMLELGQPLHAFDYDKVADHTIIVRRAEPGETLTTLDGVTRHLTPEMLLITDPAGPNVIAGIFGGARVEVSDSTTNVLLEAAHFKPTSIRRTSVALGLRTESSGRFEKGPDTELTAVAADRAAALLAELAGGTVAPGRVDFYPQPVSQRELTFEPGQVPWLTGMTVTRNEVIESLSALGFGVSDAVPGGAEETLRVTVPTWRGDVEESADLVEEVARIAGYERIPSTIPTGPLPPPSRDPWFRREDRIREVLSGAGLTETILYTLTSRAAMASLLPGAGGRDELLLAAPAPGARADGAGAAGDTTSVAVSGRAAERREIAALAERLPAIALVNPLSSELGVLRLTLMSGLLDIVRENAKHSDAGLWFFELGRRYLPTAELADGTGLADERHTLAIALAGPLVQSWAAPDRDADFYDLKGVVETLLGALKVAGYRFAATRHPTFHPGRAALLEVAVPRSHEQSEGGAENVEAAWTPVAVLGEAHPDVAERFDLTKRTYLMEMDLERLYLAVPETARQRSIARYPAAQRDLAIVLAQDAPAAAVKAAIRASGAPLMRGARLFDVYTGAGIPEGHKSLAYAITYQSAERTLTDAEVERAQAAIVATLRERFGAELRG
jgi:phenylalanyl-tRNA synthetase beta chain